MTSPRYALVFWFTVQATGCGSRDVMSFDADFRCTFPNAGIVGLTNVQLSGEPVIAGTNASVFSNGDIVMDGLVTVGLDLMSVGNVIPHDGHNVMGAIIEGLAPISVLDPSDAVAAAALDNDNDLIPCVPFNDGLDCRDALTSDGILDLANTDELTLPGGTYWFREIHIDGSARLNVDGNATIYLENGGQLNSFTTATSLTVISATSSQSIEFNGATAVNLDVYAPYATVLFTGDQQFSGSVVGGDVRLSGSASVTTNRDALAPWITCADEGDTGGTGFIEDLPPLPDLAS